MFTPGKRVCDICQKNELEPPDYCVLFYPFTPDQRDTIAEAMTDLIAGEGGARQMFGQIVPIAIPPGTRMEFCRECVDNFLPMGEQLRNQAVAHTLEKIKEQAAAQGKDKGPGRRRIFDDD